MFRALDIELARFALAHAPSAPPSFVLAVALLSRLEGFGHVCMDLNTTSDERLALLAWPPDHAELFSPELAQLPESGVAACKLWAGLSHVLADGRESEPQTPFVLDSSRLYLRRYWALERRVAQQVRTRSAATSVAESGRAESACETAGTRPIQTSLDRLFGAPAAGAAVIDWQRVACERALEAGFTLITGGPGTGKTYTAARLLVLLQALHPGPRRLRVGLAAPTGKAAARLRQSIEAGFRSLASADEWAALQVGALHLPQATTLHALLGVRPGTRRFIHNYQNPLALDVVLVDEASMVHLELFDALLQALPPTTRLVLMGDSEQLSSVEAGSVLADLCAVPTDSALARQTVKLRASHRFSGAIGLAAQAANQGDADALLRLLADPPDASVRALKAKRAGARKTGLSAALPADVVADVTADVAAFSLSSEVAPTHGAWLSRLKQRPAHPQAFDAWAKDLIRSFDNFRVLCAVREGPRGVAGVNAAIEREALARHWLQRREAWYEGRPIMVLRNDAALGLFNGDTGLVLQAPATPAGLTGLRAWFLQGDSLRSVAVARLPEVETAYAMTVHKSQGSEFEHVLLVMPDSDFPMLTRELVYTGITRARQWLTVAHPSDDVLASAVKRRTWRMSGLRI